MDIKNLLFFRFLLEPQLKHEHYFHFQLPQYTDALGPVSALAVIGSKVDIKRVQISRHIIFLKLCFIIKPHFTKNTIIAQMKINTAVPILKYATLRLLFHCI